MWKTMYLQDYVATLKTRLETNIKVFDEETYSIAEDLVFSFNLVDSKLHSLVCLSHLIIIL